MVTETNKQIASHIELGNYVARNYNESTESLQSRMVNDNDYHYNITTADNVLHFTTKHKTYSLNLKDFDWKLLWDKLGNIPVNEDDEIEESFEHFDVGTDKYDIWHWFEWFFDVTLGDEVFN